MTPAEVRLLLWLGGVAIGRPWGALGGGHAVMQSVCSRKPPYCTKYMRIYDLRDNSGNGRKKKKNKKNSHNNGTRYCMMHDIIIL